MSQLTEEIKIIKVGTNKLKAVVDLRIRLLREIGNIDPDDNIVELKDKLYDYFKINISNGNFKAWVAIVNDKVVATSGLIYYQVPPHMSNLQGTEAYIMNMYTIPEYRGQGIAEEILITIVDYAERENIDKLWLRAEEKAKSLYHRVGFRQSEKYMELKE